jgi:hypothetical protein
MKLRAIITCIILESPEGERITVRQGITKLQIITMDNKEYKGSVMNFDDNYITLILGPNKVKAIEYNDIIEVLEIE